MNIYTIQFRQERAGRLIRLGLFRARSPAGAIAQAARLLSAGGDDAVEIVATAA